MAVPTFLLAPMNLDRLSENFTVKEFTCKCGCGMCRVEPELLRQLELLRAILGKPLSINSGCRCPKYNEAIKSKKDSQHVTTQVRKCAAADIHAPLGIDKYELVKAAFLLGGFTGIGIADSFCHFDVRTSEARLWTY